MFVHIYTHTAKYSAFANTYLSTSKHPERPQTLKTAKVQVLNISTALGETDEEDAVTSCVCVCALNY